jgi:hypothetical protein
MKKQLPGKLDYCGFLTWRIYGQYSLFKRRTWLSRSRLADFSCSAGIRMPCLVAALALSMR